ncbi:MAG: IS1 family transposase [Rhodocyclaceae bacterium]|jgi:hypothetical protein|nr:IS1 family transposase [Rhodocyclaceae bacterium]MCE2724328.1 hypothetical protein [Betaproteobacteria bacterium]MCA3018529.1 IS1 family transposase [Rhodocyclaceae bacterium]MCA3024584.1 IS1 family transposase [Rhodocyclaceae bacterium]MCA3027779.1 IS1 family transposase [Rhodocyclaceae bacterium]
MGAIFLAKIRPHPRVPAEHEGLQVNHCKNPHCANFGVPAPESRGRKGLKPDLIGAYTVAGNSENGRFLTCGLCGRTAVLYSNVGIADEIKRFDIRAERAASTGCPNESCDAFGSTVVSTPDAYYRHGHTAAGADRFRCRTCGSTFSAAAPVRRQRRPELSIQVLKLLVNKVPMRRICEVLDLNPATLYNKIGFLAEVASEQSARFEARLSDPAHAPSRAYVSADRQDHVLNWGTQLDRRNIWLGALAAVENKTGYVLGMQLNFDSSLNAEDVEADAIACGDYDLPLPYRRYARLWLRREYKETTGALKPVEGFDMGVQLKLPHSGLQVHLQYTQQALMFHVQRLLQHVDKVRLFVDRDPGFASACMSPFKAQIRARRAEVFAIGGPKSMTMAQKKVVIAQYNREFERFVGATYDAASKNLRHLYVRQHLEAWLAQRKSGDPFRYPLADMAEPGKDVWHLTDFGEMDLDHLANLYMRVSLRGVDRFFMQVRRRLSILERPISTGNSNYRRWNGYAAYSPLVAERVLRIFRSYYNLALVGEDRKTPAMRLGLTDQPVPLADLATFPRVPRP